ncbi:alkaline shock response membrane anchor protein AmaP [Streptomyces sp. NPDC004959]|uniref:alkaline shock response membrane anchor protein AmaP n=1 Tax=Streptomyces sp. NPDC004959 TaxID=3154673 RepID=UPI0033B92FB8
MLRTLNRVLLALAGLVLIALGGSVLAVGYGVRPPHWWVHQGAHDVLFTAGERTRWRQEGWWWPVVIAALAVLLLLSLWWLAAGLRRRHLSALPLDTGDDEDSAQLRGSALEQALGAHTERLDGVERARVRLRGRPGSPVAHLHLTLAADAAPLLVQHHAVTETLKAAKEATGQENMRAEVRMKGVPHGAERVR